jgi:hypothetical protein
MPNQTPTVEKLPSNILNYYAAFTETKFNFKTLINYRWTNNELTLDLSLFQNFQEHLLQRLKSGDATPPPFPSMAMNIRCPFLALMLG